MVKAFFDSHPVLIRLAALVTGLAYAAPAMAPASPGPTGHDAAHRNSGRAISVLQRRNGRGDRWHFLEALRRAGQTANG